MLAGQAIFSSFTGGSNLAIAVSTLVVAALFLPLRARLQRRRRPPLLPPPVRRRNARSRHSAPRRDEVELEGLRSDLRGRRRETMQPAHVSLWLRSAAAMSRGPRCGRLGVVVAA